MELREKVAYVSGLMDGLDFEPQSKEGRMFDAILSVLDEIADALDDVQEDQEDLEEFVEALDEDLTEVEEILGFSDDDEDEDDEDDEDEDEDDTFVDIQCPQCGEVVCFDPNVIWESDESVEVMCPNCDAVVFSTEACGEDCDCLDEEDLETEE